MRWFLEYLYRYLRQYIVEDDLGGRPYNHEERSLVYAWANAMEGRFYV